MSLAHSPQIVTNGLVYLLDPANSKCWDGISTTMTSLVNNATNNITNSPYGINSTSYSVRTLTLNNTASLITATSTASVTLSTPDLNTLALSNNFTVMFAAKKNYYGLGGNNNGNSEFFRGVNNGYGTGWRITEFSFGTPGAEFTGKHNFTLGMSDQFKSYNAADTISTNRLSIVAFSISSSVVTGFINGTFNTSTNGLAYVSGPSLPTISVTSAGEGSWNGEVGFLMIYNRALSSDEISQNFNAYRGRYGV